MNDHPMTLQQRQADPLSRIRARIGRRIFSVYLSLYGVFVLLHVFFPQWTGYQIGGLGLGLIACVVLMLATFVSTLLFHVLCARLERKSAGGTTP